MDWTMFKDPITTVCAIVGAGLGVFNFVQGFWQRRVRLEVIPRMFSTARGARIYSTNELPPHSLPCIEVVNLSAFPVTLSEVGFTLSGEKGRAQLLPDAGMQLPHRMDSRASIIVHCGERAVIPRNIKRAYAKTACQKLRCGNSPALKKLREVQRAKMRT